MPIPPSHEKLRPYFQRSHVNSFRISKPCFITQKIPKNGKWEVGNENAGHENAYSDFRIRTSAFT